jgi:hypothetical protein
MRVTTLRQRQKLLTATMQFCWQSNQQIQEALVLHCTVTSMDLDIELEVETSRLIKYFF